MWQHLRILARRVHRDEAGAVSLETILLLAAIALPVLVVILKFGWPAVKGMFESNHDRLKAETNRIVDGS